MKEKTPASHINQNCVCVKRRKAKQSKAHYEVIAELQILHTDSTHRLRFESRQAIRTRRARSAIDHHASLGSTSYCTCVLCREPVFSHSVHKRPIRAQVIPIYDCFLSELVALPRKRSPLSMGIREDALSPAPQPCFCKQTHQFSIYLQSYLSSRFEAHCIATEYSSLTTKQFTAVQPHSPLFSHPPAPTAYRRERKNRTRVNLIISNRGMSHALVPPDRPISSLPVLSCPVYLPDVRLSKRCHCSRAMSSSCVAETQ